jgi:amino acid permease
MEAPSSPRNAALSFRTAFSSLQSVPSDVESLNGDFRSLSRSTRITSPLDEGADDQVERARAANTPTTSCRSGGSSVRAAIFNFTNAIIGAGAIGLGGAFALSGGCISIASILVCAHLTKRSLDLVLELSLEQGVTSYEELGRLGYGRVGQLLVTWSKLLYSVGCMVAYIIVIKENLGPALLSLVPSKLDPILLNSNLSTFLTSLLVILPLCLLRDMTPLANFSLLSVLAMVMIVGIVAYLFFFPPVTDHDHDKSTTVYEDWFEIRWRGYLQSLGTFVFTFVSVRFRGDVSCDVRRVTFD